MAVRGAWAGTAERELVALVVSPRVYFTEVRRRRSMPQQNSRQGRQEKPAKEEPRTMAQQEKAMPSWRFRDHAGEQAQRTPRTFLPVGRAVSPSVRLAACVDLVSPLA